MAREKTVCLFKHLPNCILYAFCCTYVITPLLGLTELHFYNIILDDLDGKTMNLSISCSIFRKCLTWWSTILLNITFLKYFKSDIILYDKDLEFLKWYFNQTLSGFDAKYHWKIHACLNCILICILFFLTRKWCY